jgi:nicotinamide-nucleotide amidase
MISSKEAVGRVAELAVEKELMVAAAESLTSGLIAHRLGAGPNAADWFRGSVVAYQEPVKFEVLGVREGPVVTAECAEEMARGAARLLAADVAVAATGVGGPDPSEGKPAGTVYVAVTVDGKVTTRELDLDGDPEEILQDTASHAIDLLLDTLAAHQPPPSEGVS